MASIVDDLLNRFKADGKRAVAGAPKGAAEAGEVFGRAANRVAGRKVFDGSADTLRSIAQDLAASADADRAKISAERTQAAQDSAWQGNLFDGTARLGPDASLAGVAMNFAGAAGSVAPSIAAGLATKGRSLRTQATTGALLGGAMGGGAASMEEDERTRAMGDAEIAALPAYQQALAQGMDPATARDVVARQAGAGAFAATAPVSALGGSITSGLFGKPAQGAVARMVGNAAPARIAASTAIGAVEEGAQEVAEGVAQRAGASQATGEQGRELGEESAANLMGGLMGGAPGGAIAGAAQSIPASAPGASAPQAQAPGAPVVVNPARGVLSRAVAAGAAAGMLPGVQVERPEFLGAPADGAGSRMMPMGRPLSRGLVEAPRRTVPATFTANLAPPDPADDKLKTFRAGIEPLPEPASLEDDPALYFNLRSADQLVTPSLLRLVRADDPALPKSSSQARKLMAAAAEGLIDRRDPINVQAEPDGTYTVLDGNATVDAAMRAGFAELPVRIREAAPGKEGWRNERGYLPLPAQAELTRQYEMATTAKPQFDQTVSALAEQLGARVKTAELKGRTRAEQKAADDYLGNPTRISDLLRATVELDDLGAVQRTMETLRQAYPVVREKHFLDQAAETPYAGGYRDSKLVVTTPEGVSAEIQVNLKPMLEAKEKAHKFYAEWRELDARITAENREPTPQEFLRLKELDAAQRAIYEPAWTAAATSSSNVASEITTPFLPTESRENARGLAASNASTAPVSEFSATGTPSTSKNREPSGNLGIGLTPEAGVVGTIDSTTDAGRVEALGAPAVPDAIRLKETTQEEGDLARTFNLHRDGQKIGEAEMFIDDYDGRGNAWHLGFVGLNKNARGGSGADAIRAAANQAMADDDAPNYVTAEAMSKKSLRAMLRVFGTPDTISTDIRKLSLDEALDELPDDAPFDDETFTTRGGNKVFVAFKLPKSRRLDVEPAALGAPKAPAQDYGVIVAPKPGTKVMVDGEPQVYDRARDGDNQPPAAGSVQREPDLDELQKRAIAIFKRPAAATALSRLFGAKAVKLKTLRGSYEGTPELSFSLTAAGLTPDNARQLSQFLGMAFAQDAVIVTKPDPVGPTEDSIPTIELASTNGAKIAASVFDAVTAELRAQGIDYSEARDGAAIRVLHFGDEAEFEALAVAMASAASAHGLEANALHTRSELYEAQDYRRNLQEGGPEGGAGQRPEVFRALVDQFLVPYTKAIAATGYRFDARRYADRFGLAKEELSYLTGKLRAAYEPRSSVPVLTGEEALPARAGRATNVDAGVFLQNRAAAFGAIPPTDRSAQAKEAIAETLAQEVAYQINKPDGKQAIGWYDRQLNAALDTIATVHPEIGSDDNARFVFKALLAASSQNLAVEKNFEVALKLYRGYLDKGVLDLKGITLPGKAAPVARQNVAKLQAMITDRGLPETAAFMREMHAVHELKALGFKDVNGLLDEQVRGWLVFGPKIGSFGNNLDGDFDTLTADLWFSRTWNRVLGTMFKYSAKAEANTIREFRAALVEAMNTPGTNHLVDAMSEADRDAVGTFDGDFALAEALSRDFAKGYKDKSNLNRRAKAWVENVKHLQDVPRGGPERRWQNEIMRAVQAKVRERSGEQVSIADLQALLWYQEKELFRILGAANKQSAPLDYQDAAKAAIAEVEPEALGVAGRNDATTVTMAYPMGADYLLKTVRRIAKGARVAVVAGTDKAVSKLAVDRLLTTEESAKLAKVAGVRAVAPGVFPTASALRQGGERKPPPRFQVPAAVLASRSYAALDEEQAATVDKALASLKRTGYPKAWLQRAEYFFAHNNEQQFAARFYLYGETKGAISLSHEELASQKHVERLLAHELAHAADYDPQAEAFRSLTSPRFALAKAADGSTVYTGDVIAELHAAHTANTPLAAELKYPFLREDFSADVTQVEAFAQAVMLYHTQRADLRRHAPKTHAMIQEMFAGESNDATGVRGDGAIQGALQATGSRALGVQPAAGAVGQGNRAVDRGERDRPAAGGRGPRSGGEGVTESATFRKWAEGAEFVPADEGDAAWDREFASGAPVVLEAFHGTGQSFDSFDNSRGPERSDKNLDGAAWFTNDPSVANVFAGGQTGETFGLGTSYEVTTGHAQVYRVFVKMMNPYVDKRGEYAKHGGLRTKDIAELEESGHDGVIWPNAPYDLPDPPDGYKRDDKGRYYGEDIPYPHQFATWKPGQIKSATANSGAFDPTNPSILGAPPMPPVAAAFSGYTIPSWELGSHLSSEAGQRMEGYRTAAKAGGEKLRTYLQDYFLPVRRVQEAITATGGTITEDSDVYGREEVYYGRTGEQLRQLEDDHVKPLVKAMHASGVTQADAELYLYAKFAPKRNARIAAINPKFPDGGSGMTDADAAQVLADFAAAGQTAKLEAIAKRIRALNEVRLRTLEEGGLLSTGEAAMWREEADYVPLKGLAEGVGGKDGEGTRQPTGQGFSIGGKEAHRALGRKSRATDLMANVIAQTEQAIIRAEKNRVAIALLRLAEENPNPALWTVDKVPEKPQLSAAGEVSYRKDNLHQMAENVVSVKVNGEQHFVTLLDTRLAASMKNLGAAKMGAFLRAFSSINRFLSLTRTMLAPEFVLANFARDLQTAAVNLTGDESAAMAARVVKDVPKAMRAMWGQLRNKSAGGEWSRWAQEFAEEGGMTSFVAQYTVEEQQAKVSGLLKDAQGGTRTAIKQLVRGTFDLIENANGAVENGTRLSAYANARRSGMSKQQAARVAKNLTVNFNRKGQAGPTLNALYLFYNASIQGTVRFLRAMKSPKVQGIMAATAVMGLSLASYNRAAGGEDDDGEDRWDKIPEWEKARNLILFIPGSDGQTVKIPLPYSYNIPFLVGAQVESMLYSKRPASEAALNIAEAMLTSFNPIGDLDLKGDSATALAKVISPTVADPLVDIAVNKNFFGAPISPERSPFDKVPEPDSQLAYASTNPAARWLAKALNSATGGDALRAGLIDVSPGSMVYIFDYLTGGTGGFVERSMTAAMLAAQGEPVPANKVPFLRVFKGELSDRRVTDTFYRVRDDIHLKAEMAEIGRHGGGFDSPADRRDAAMGRKLSGRLRVAERQLSVIRKRRKQAQLDGDKAKVKVFETRERAIQLGFNKAYFTALDAAQD